MSAPAIAPSRRAFLYTIARAADAGHFPGPRT